MLIRHWLGPVDDEASVAVTEVGIMDTVAASFYAGLGGLVSDNYAAWQKVSCGEAVARIRCRYGIPIRFLPRAVSGIRAIP